MDWTEDLWSLMITTFPFGHRLNTWDVTVDELGQKMQVWYRDRHLTFALKLSHFQRNGPTRGGMKIENDYSATAVIEFTNVISALQNVLTGHFTSVERTGILDSRVLVMIALRWTVCATCLCAPISHSDNYFVVFLFLLCCGTRRWSRVCAVFIKCDRNWSVVEGVIEGSVFEPQWRWNRRSVLQVHVLHCSPLSDSSCSFRS